MGMQIAALIILGLIGGGVGVYLYHYLLRIADLFGIERRNKLVRGLAAGITVAVVLGIGFYFRMGSIVAVHFFAIAWILEGVNAVVRRIGRGRKRRWRVVFSSGVLPVLLTCIVLGYGYWNMGQVKETDYVVTTKKTIPEEGYLVALISDLHYPTTMGSEKLTAYCKEIAEKKPDLVVLGGDIVDENTSYNEMQEAIRVLSGIPSKLGTYYVYGNHDMAAYRTPPAFTKQQLRDTFTAAGIQVLEDSTKQVTKDLFLVGRSDCGFGKKDTRKPVAELLKGSDPSDFILVLDHQPKSLTANREAGADLQLSGHTHAGQIFPGGLVSELFGINEQTYGLRKQGTFTSIVTSGIAGWGTRFRTEAHSEYVMIKIKSE